MSVGALNELAERDYDLNDCYTDGHEETLKKLIVKYDIACEFTGDFVEDILHMEDLISEKFRKLMIGA